jgi:hypothetical protein
MVEHVPLPHEAPEALHAVQDAIADVVGSELVGLYLYGSLVAGGFDRNVSDLDLIAVLRGDPSGVLVSRLAAMHDALARLYPAWAERIEVVYVGQPRLQRWREPIPRMAVISPGEAFHTVSAGREWLLAWYPARDEAVAMMGPALSDVIPELPREAFLRAVRERLSEFRTEPMDDASPGACAYAVLTTCRGLYTLEFGRRTSKLEAAEWTAERHPEWAELIAAAIQWRQQQWETRAPDPAVIDRTRRFLSAMTR